MIIVKITLLLDVNILTSLAYLERSGRKSSVWRYLKPESTISAINSTERYGLENLKSIHDAFSDGFAMTQNDKSSISAPDAIAVYR